MTLHFDPDRLREGGCILPPHISDDPWVIYHGTTNLAEARIDREGFTWQPETYTRDEVMAVANIFKSMNWYGDSTESAAVLIPYTRTDFRAGERKPVYFAEHSARVGTWASRRFVGGETAYALRNAFAAFRNYLSDPAIRQAHWDYQATDARRTVEQGGLPRHVMRVNLDWLASRLDRLAELEKRLLAPVDRYEYGVVYAVRVPESALAQFTFDASRGAESWLPVPPEWIVAKVHIDDLTAEDSWRIDTFERDCWLLGTASFISRAAPPELEPAKEFALSLTTDPKAGTDEATEIGPEFGTAEVQAALRNNPTARTADSVF